MDARPSNALLDEGEIVKSPNSQIVDASSAYGKEHSESRRQNAKGADESQELEGEVHGKKIWERSDVLNATKGKVVESEGENGKGVISSAKKWDGIEQNRKGKEDEGRKMGGTVKNRGEWEVARVPLEDTQDFVRDGFHGKVAGRGLGQQDGEREKKEKRSNGDKSGESDDEESAESGESDDSSESGDSGDSVETGERGVREKNEKTSNGEILSSLAPLILVIISLL